MAISGKKKFWIRSYFSKLPFFFFFSRIEFGVFKKTEKETLMSLNTPYNQQPDVCYCPKFKQSSKRNERKSDCIKKISHMLFHSY